MLLTFSVQQEQLRRALAAQKASGHAGDTPASTGGCWGAFSPAFAKGDFQAYIFSLEFYVGENSDEI